MFARVKKSGKYQYLQLVENRKEKGRVKQQVIATLGRMDELSAKGRVETLIRSLSRFSQQAILIITGKSDVSLAAKKIGPALIFERLWKQTGIGEAIRRQAAERKFGFDVERAVFLTVLHRLDGIRFGSLLRPLASRLCHRRGGWHRAAASVSGHGVSGRRACGSNAGHGLCPALHQGSNRGGDLFSPPRSVQRSGPGLLRYHLALLSRGQAETVSVSAASARIIARISSRWCSGWSSMTRGNPSAVRCGRATRLMSKACCPWWSRSASALRSAASASWPTGA